MRNPAVAACLFCSLTTTALCAPEASQERPWTGVNGATFLGTYARTLDQGKKVQFLTSEGKIVTVAVENLSEKDREIIRAFEGKGPAKPAPAAASKEAFKELPVAARMRIPTLKPKDFGGTDDESVVDALWVSLLWWDATGIVPIPKTGDTGRKATWLHKELSRYVAKGGKGAASLQEAQRGVGEYFNKRLEETATCKCEIRNVFEPGELAKLATGNDIVILRMTMTYSNARDFVVAGVLESMEADGSFVMHLFGERFTGRMAANPEREPERPGEKTHELTLSDREKMPEHYKTQGARFYFGENSWNGVLLMTPYVYKTPGKKAPIPG
jgi:hypothetical protein